MSVRTEHEWIKELVSAIHMIDLNWEKGDLAGAVREACGLADEACQVFDFRIDKEDEEA